MTRGVDKSLLIMYAPALLYRLLRLNCNNVDSTMPRTGSRQLKEYPKQMR